MRFCDNEDVCKSTTKTEAVLIKKHHSIAYHPDRKTVATNKSCPSKGLCTTLSDLFVKTRRTALREDLWTSLPIE
jgi:hypothetical protein